MNEGALANVDSDVIIERIANGEYAAHLAPEFGVSKQGFQKHISKHPGYRKARELGCEFRIERALAEFDAMQIPRPPLKPLSADIGEIAQWKQDYQTWKDGLRLTMVDLARAEASFKAITWHAEREFPERWGAKAQVNVTIDLGGALQAISERLQTQTIEHDATQQLDVSDALDVTAKPDEC